MIKVFRFVAASAVCLAIGCSGPAATTTDDEYVKRMATEHKDDTPEAGAAGDAELGAVPDLSAEKVVYGATDGKPLTGVLVSPDPAVANGPAIIMIHEWWGLNDNVVAMAKRLAGEGYTVLAVDMYGGNVGTTPDEARALMQASMKVPELLTKNLEQAHTYLKDNDAGKIGTMGWCFGGAWSLKGAVALGDGVDAAVIYYGHVGGDEAALKGLEAPVLGIFGGADKGIPLESVTAFEAALAAQEKTFTIEIYEGAEHAFANPSGGRYNADAARDAWAKTLTFFTKHLQAAP